MAVTATHVDLKIFVDREKGRVLFAEADSDFAEVLFSFLTLPLGTIVRLVGKTRSEPAASVGCFGSLYQSVTSLGNEHFRAEDFKDVLLHPRSSTEDMRRELKIDIDDTEAKYYLCERDNCRGSYMGFYRNASCGWCHYPMTVEKKLGASQHGSKGEYFFSKALKFIITDNLEVSPVVPGTFLGYLNNFGTIDSNMIEEKTVKLGRDEFIELLKRTLLSTTPLTDLFCSKTKVPLSSVPKKVSLQKAHSGKCKKINVKVLLNKSSKEFLFVEAGKDFIDFLFSLLLIPLGEMLHILEGQSGLACIDGLYKSIQSLDSKHFGSDSSEGFLYHLLFSPETQKNILVRPKLPPYFSCKDHLFPLESSPMTHTIDGYKRTIPEVDTIILGDLRLGGFVRDKEVFIVLDDLTVKPFSAAAAISIINTHKTSFSDLEERTLSLGTAEGISILRASLNSTNAISNGLLGNNIVFTKEPKQEK